MKMKNGKTKSNAIETQRISATLQNRGCAAMGGICKRQEKQLPTLSCPVICLASRNLPLSMSSYLSSLSYKSLGKVGLLANASMYTAMVYFFNGRAETVDNEAEEKSQPLSEETVLACIRLGTILRGIRARLASEGYTFIEGKPVKKSGYV